jgi:hypothetical protein
LVASSGIEPELSALRGRRVNQLHHDAHETRLQRSALRCFLMVIFSMV